MIPLIALSLIYKIPFMRYWKKPQWNELIGIPFIWSGFHQSKVKYFLLIALTINLFTFMPFMIRNGWTYIQEVWLLAIIFSVTNAVFEEVIWRFPWILLGCLHRIFSWRVIFRGNYDQF
jgi:hypothetical protein